MARPKKSNSAPSIQLEDCNLILQKIINIADKEIDNLAAKSSLSSEELKNLVALQTCVSTIYKDYKQEAQMVKKELSTMSREQILNLVKAEGN